MFFWFNAGAVAFIAAGNMLFDSLGGHWVILPIVWMAGFATHAFTFHLFWTIRRNTYSSHRRFCSRLSRGVGARLAHDPQSGGSGSGGVCS